MVDVSLPPQALQISRAKLARHVLRYPSRVGESGIL